MPRVQLVSFGKRILKSYTNLLRKYPLRMQSIQTGFLVGTGDVLAQTVVERRELKNIDKHRCLSFGTVGLGIGPSIGIWYQILERFLGAGGMKVVIKKIALDQLVFAPAFCGVMLTTFGLIQGQKIEDIKENIRHKYVDILLTNYKIWPLVQLVNFYFVPLMYRVLLVQTVAVGWNTYLSWKVNAKYD